MVTPAWNSFLLNASNWFNFEHSDKMRSTVGLQDLLFFPKSFPIFIGTIENPDITPVFYLSLCCLNVLPCTLHDLNRMCGKESCFVQPSVPCTLLQWEGNAGSTQRWAERCRTCAGREGASLNGDKWDYVWREPFASWWGFRISMGSNKFLTVNSKISSTSLIAAIFKEDGTWESRAGGNDLALPAALVGAISS